MNLLKELVFGSLMNIHSSFNEEKLHREELSNSVFSSYLFKNEKIIKIKN